MKFKTSNEPLASFSYSSLTDIVMLLLIFFLLTSQFVIQTGVKVKLPGSETNEKDSAPKKGLQILKVNLGLEGSGYQNLKIFLSALENNLRIFDLESLNWDPSDTSFEVSFKTYYYLPTAESPGSSNLPGNANIGP